jgi:hypothetical protein
MSPATNLIWVAEDEERKEMAAYEELLKKREKTLGNRRLRVMWDLDDTRFRWWIYNLPYIIWLPLFHTC